MSEKNRTIVFGGMFTGAIIGAIASMIFTNDPTLGTLLGFAIGGFVAVPVTLDLDSIEA